MPLQDWDWAPPPLAFAHPELSRIIEFFFLSFFRFISFPKEEILFHCEIGRCSFGIVLVCRFCGIEIDWFRIKLSLDNAMPYQSVRIIFKLFTFCCMQQLAAPLC
jgi:hypothetical protein